MNKEGSPRQVEASPRRQLIIIRGIGTLLDEHPDLFGVVNKRTERFAIGALFGAGRVDVKLPLRRFSSHDPTTEERVITFELPTVEDYPYAVSAKIQNGEFTTGEQSFMHGATAERFLATMLENRGAIKPVQSTHGLFADQPEKVRRDFAGFFDFAKHQELPTA